MPAPNTKDWAAYEHTNFAGGDRKITVEGKVEVTSTGSTAALREAEPTPINKTILMLDLVVTPGGGGSVMNYKDVKFEKPCEEDQYKEVTILFENDKIESVPVEKRIS